MSLFQSTEETPNPLINSNLSGHDNKENIDLLNESHREIGANLMVDAYSEEDNTKIQTLSSNAAAQSSSDLQNNQNSDFQNYCTFQKAIINQLGPVDKQNSSCSQKEQYLSVFEKQESARKFSQAESEINCEEMKEEEQDIRRQINQKLIRNKNYFMHFMRNPETNGDANSHPVKMKGGKYGFNPQMQSTGFSQIIDKRSRSETPDKMSATEVLLRAHHKLAAQAAKRKESPDKILEKHNQRQKKAEELRSQIEQSKKHWYEKIRIRQQIAKRKWHELLAERRAKLQDKLEQAEERRETELQTVKEKAKQEIQKIDETNFIVKMTMNNMKLDLKSKMSETQERRNQIMEEYIKKKQADRAQKEEAAEKRRQELQKSTENKFLTNQQKREQADLRRSKMIEERRRAAHEAHKRSIVLQRKNDLGEKISDVMSFVNNSEFIWEFLGNERDWQDLGAFDNSCDENILFQLMQKDQIDIEKMKLKKDAEILSQMIIVQENGEVYSNKFLIPLLRKKKNNGFESPNQNSSDDDTSDDRGGFDRDVELLLTPERLRRLQQNSPQQKTTDEESKSQDEHGDYISDGSDKDSIPEESSQNKGGSTTKQDQQQLHSYEYFTEDIQNYMLYSQRLKMSMKRNVLKKNLSEDLTWADFLKNESYQYHQSGLTSFKIAQTRSMRSTPERKQDITSDTDEKLSNDRVHTEEAENKPNQKITIGKINQNPGKKLKSGGTLKSSSNPHTSSSSNLSEKSRISSVVYPSKNKKTPRNQVESKINQPQPSDPKQLINQKKNLGSHQSSTQSLNLISQQSETSGTAIKKVAIQTEIDSARKREGRLHSSSVQETSSTGFTQLQQQPPSAHNTSVLDDSCQLNTNEKLTESNQTSHTGSQMNQLIQNTKPILATTKMIPKKLTANAIKMLFPIREQKLLIKRPGKEGQFGKFKITVKMEDLTLQKSNICIQNQNANLASQQNPNDSVDDKLQSQKSFVSQSQIPTTISESEKRDSPSLKRSSHNTPQNQNRRESIESQNQASQQQQNTVSNLQENLTGTPNQSTSRLLQIQQKFWEKYQNQNQLQQEDSAGSKKQSQNITTQSQSQQSSSELNQSTPKKELKLSQFTKHTSSEVDFQGGDQNKSTDSTSMNETGYKEQILKYLLSDNINLLKNEDNQKTISLEQNDSDNKLIDYLEQNEAILRYCRLCDLMLPDHTTNEAHIVAKSHKKTRDELCIKELEDQQFSLLSIISQPGDIEKELLKEKEKALKRKVKRIKAQMIAQTISHEAAIYCPGKEYNSPNKKRLQILCLELEKQVQPIINNYEALENTLKEIIKILDMRKLADLHLMRKLKFISILIEICKRISVCHKNEFKHIGRMLDYVIKIINTFCGQRENRNYMLQTNRMLALVELLNWCLNRPTQLFYGINFMPTLFHILTLHIKHRAPYECQQMKELFIEYLVCSQITMKIKQKCQIINGPLDLSETMGQIPLFLLKSAAFVEALTNLLSIDAISRPVYEKSQKIGDHVLFVFQNTELFGIIPTITSILLSRNQPFKPSQNFQQTISGSNKILPQTLLSLAITSVKILNNILRMDYKSAQQMMSDFEIQEQLYHLFNYLLYYSIETVDQQEDSKELLHETLLLIGYFALDNPKHQQILCKGENTLIQKLCNMPFTYFCDRKLKDILFPTLIQASYKNDRCLAIMDQEISIDLIVDFIQLNLKEELPKIVEEKDEYHSISSLGGLVATNGNGAGGAIDMRTPRSPSQSSASSQCSLQIDLVNGNSPFLPLYMRFPKKLWKDAIQFYSQVLY